MSAHFRPLIALLSLLLVLQTALQPARAGGPNADAAPVDVAALVEEAYTWADLAELERLHVVYSQPGLRASATGYPQVSKFWEGVHRVHRADPEVTDAYYQQLEALTAQWARERPASPFVQILHGRALLAHAWALRGTGYSDTVTPAAWKLFDAQVRRALAQLRRAEKVAVNDSEWNLAMLELGRVKSWDVADMRRIYEAGLAKNPDHDALHTAMLTSLLPKWGGSVEESERFIAQAVKAARGSQALRLYADLYAHLSHEQVNQRLFTDTRASWPAMKQGFEERLKLFPDVENRGGLAYFACMAGDRDTLQAQLEALGDSPGLKGWGSNAKRTYEACKRFAQQS